MKRLFLLTTSAFAISIGTAWADSNNSAFVEQIGSGNQMTINQKHDLSTSSTPSENNQVGSAGNTLLQNGTNNAITIVQGEHSGGDDSIGVNAPVLQSGDSNTLSMFQFAGNNVINEAHQTGAGNTGTIVQSTGGAGSFVDLFEQRDQGNVGVIEQINTPSSHATLVQGDSTRAATNNFSHIFQVAPGGSNQATSMQFGDGNSSEVIQSDGNISYTGFQDGNLNITEVKQSGPDMVASTSVIGDSNLVDLFQNENAMTASLSLNGNGNRLVVDQFSGDGNLVDVALAGNNTGTRAFNSGGAAASITQLTAQPIDGATILQNGDNNSVSVTGTNADGNVFGLEQAGDGNVIVGHFENGAGVGDNEAAVFQGGNGNYANFTVSGTGNSLGIAQ